MVLQKGGAGLGHPIVADSGAEDIPVTEMTGDGGDIIASNAAVIALSRLRTHTKIVDYLWSSREYIGIYAEIHSSLASTDTVVFAKAVYSGGPVSGGGTFIRETATDGTWDNTNSQAGGSSEEDTYYGLDYVLGTNMFRRQVSAVIPEHFGAKERSEAGDLTSQATWLQRMSDCCCRGNSTTQSDVCSYVRRQLHFCVPSGSYVTTSTIKLLSPRFNWKMDGEFYVPYATEITGMKVCIASDGFGLGTTTDPVTASERDMKEPVTIKVFKGTGVEDLGMSARARWINRCGIGANYLFNTVSESFGPDGYTDVEMEALRLKYVTCPDVGVHITGMRQGNHIIVKQADNFCIGVKAQSSKSTNIETDAAARLAINCGRIEVLQAACVKVKLLVCTYEDNTSSNTQNDPDPLIGKAAIGWTNSTQYWLRDGGGSSGQIGFPYFAYTRTSGTTRPSIGDTVTWDGGESSGVVMTMGETDDNLSGYMSVRRVSGSNIDDSPADTVVYGAWEATVSDLRTNGKVFSNYSIMVTSVVNDAPAWAPNTAYNLGDVVRSGQFQPGGASSAYTYIYVCTTDPSGTSGGVTFNSNSDVDAVNDRITTAHGLSTLDPVYYHKQGGNEPIGLKEGFKYYARKINDNTLELYDTSGHAGDSPSTTGIQNLVQGAVGETQCLYESPPIHSPPFASDTVSDGGVDWKYLRGVNAATPNGNVFDGGMDECWDQSYDNPDSDGCAILCDRSATNDFKNFRVERYSAYGRVFKFVDWNGYRCYNNRIQWTGFRQTFTDNSGTHNGRRNIVEMIDHAVLANSNMDAEGRNNITGLQKVATLRALDCMWSGHDRIMLPFPWASTRRDAYPGYQDSSNDNDVHFLPWLLATDQAYSMGQLTAQYTEWASDSTEKSIEYTPGLSIDENAGRIYLGILLKINSFAIWNRFSLARPQDDNGYYLIMGWDSALTKKTMYPLRIQIDYSNGSGTRPATPGDDVHWITSAAALNSGAADYVSKTGTDAAGTMVLDVYEHKGDGNNACPQLMAGMQVYYGTTWTADVDGVEVISRAFQSHDRISSLIDREGSFMTPMRTYAKNRVEYTLLDSSLAYVFLGLLLPKDNLESVLRHVDIYSEGIDYELIDPTCNPAHASGQSRHMLRGVPETGWLYAGQTFSAAGDLYVCTASGWACSITNSGEWQAATTYARNEMARTPGGGRVYKCVSGGLSGEGEPTAEFDSVADNGVTWAYIAKGVNHPVATMDKVGTQT